MTTLWPTYVPSNYAQPGPCPGVEDGAHLWQNSKDDTLLCVWCLGRLVRHYREDGYQISSEWIPGDAK